MVRVKRRREEKRGIQRKNDSVVDEKKKGEEVEERGCDVRVNGKGV